MKKWLVVLICFCLILGVIGCSNSTDTITTKDGTKITIEMPDKIPKDFSKEFYRDMLVANELIQKSIDAKYNYIGREYPDLLMQYYYIVNKDNLSDEDKVKVQEKNVDISKEITIKEKHCFNLLWEIDSNLFVYRDNQDNEKLKQKIESQYEQFKTLLEIEEPK